MLSSAAPNAAHRRKGSPTIRRQRPQRGKPYLFRQGSALGKYEQQLLVRIYVPSLSLRLTTPARAITPYPPQGTCLGHCALASAHVVCDAFGSCAWGRASLRFWWTALSEVFYAGSSSISSRLTYRESQRSQVQLNISAPACLCARVIVLLVILLMILR